MSAARLFDGTEDTLEEIYLSHNMLGDNLNPVFSTDEFRNLKYLRVLDLSYNGLAGISEGLITGCDELKVGASMQQLDPANILFRIYNIFMRLARDTCGYLAITTRYYCTAHGWEILTRTDSTEGDESRDCVVNLQCPDPNCTASLYKDKRITRQLAACS